MITVSELWTRLDSLAQPLASERVSLSAARGRVLRKAINAPEDQPPFDRSAIDGYLVNAKQTAGIVRLIGSSQPGASAVTNAPEIGTALRILTGSALPSADAALVMQEDTERVGVTVGDGNATGSSASSPSSIRLLVEPSARMIRKRASQARAGDTLLVANQRLGAGALALLASVGATQPLVTRRVRVAHLVTGAELVEPAAVAPALGKIRDSNSTLIAALLAEAGAELVWQKRVSDDRAETADALAEAVSTATNADVVLVSGGASVGDHDHTGALLAAQGFTLHCEKVASRPGKPFIAAAKGAQLAFGLPGNPLSHFVCFHLFVKRVLARLDGAEPAPLVRATLVAGAELKVDPRETWWPCVWVNAGAVRCVRPMPWKDSSDLTVLGIADALLRVPASTEAGAEVDVLPCR